MDIDKIFDKNISDKPNYAPFDLDLMEKSFALRDKKKVLFPNIQKECIGKLVKEHTKYLDSALYEVLGRVFNVDYLKSLSQKDLGQMMIDNKISYSDDRKFEKYVVFRGHHMIGEIDSKIRFKGVPEC